MTAPTDHNFPKRSPSAAARAEAAVWIARLHGPNRTPEVEEGLRRWLAEDSERAEAFELLTDIWEGAAQLRRNRLEEISDWQLRGVRITWTRAALAVLAVGLFAVLGTVLLLRTGGYASGIGEQRTIVLSDGTRIHLNTDSQARVHYGRSARRVELVRGEALFEVAKRPQWPFLVSAAGREVRALGTEFDVRTDRDRMAVTLVEGSVSVRPRPELLSRWFERAGQDQPGRGAQARDASYTLTPGERLTFTRDKPAQLDHPSIEALTAWRAGQIVLDNTLLADAVSEMNRYSAVPLLIEDPKIARLRISGVFTVGDSADFAQAVARTYQLSLRNERDGIVLAGPGVLPVNPGCATANSEGAPAGEPCPKTTSDITR